MRPLRLEGITAPAQASTLSGRLLRWIFDHEGRRIFSVRVVGFLGLLLLLLLYHFLHRNGVRWDRPGIGRHGLEMGADREDGNEGKHKAVYVSHGADRPHTFRVDGAHPGRN